MHEKQIGRRRAIPVICSFASYLLSQLTGCGGGGGGASPPVNQSQFNFSVIIDGQSSSVTMATANPTVLELTQRTTQGVLTKAKAGYNGLYVWSINNKIGDFASGDPHWVFEVNDRRIEGETISADAVRMKPSDRLSWKLI